MVKVWSPSLLSGKKYYFYVKTMQWVHFFMIFILFLILNLLYDGEPNDHYDIDPIMTVMKMMMMMMMMIMFRRIIKTSLIVPRVKVKHDPSFDLLTL